MKRKKKFIIGTALAVISALIVSCVVYGKEKQENNTPPTATIAAVKNSKPINLEILTDYSEQKLSALNSKLNAFKADMSSHGVNANIDVITSNKQVGTYNYTSFKSKNVTVNETFVDQVPPSTYNYYENGLSGNLSALGGYTHATRSYYYPPYTQHYHVEQNFTIYYTHNEDGTITMSGSPQHPPYLSVPDGQVPCVSADAVNIGGGSPPAPYTDWVTYDVVYDGDVTHPGYTVTTTTYTQTYTGTISGTTTDALPVNAVNVDTVKNKSFNTNSDKYLIYVSDGTGNSIQNGDGNYFGFGDLNSSFMNYLLKNNFTSYAVTPGSNYDYKLSQAGSNQTLTIRQLIGSSLDGGKLFDEGQIQNALDDIKSRYTQDALLGEINYMCTDETLTYNKTYSDAENDPQAKNSDGTPVERWRYDHDPSIYENNSGYIDNNNQWIDTPITQFGKTGEYKISYQAKDDTSARIPLGLYSMWSTGENQLVLRVHHRPIADFSMALKLGTLTINIKDNSYDIDHESRADKGLVKREFKWKLDTDSSWTDGMSPSTVQMSKTYEVAERVQDMDGNNNEGAWSNWTVKTITIGQNNPPIAQFTLDKYEMSEGEENNINDTSYDSDGDSLSERHFWVIDSSGNTVQDCLNYQPNLSNLTKGIYTIKEIVKDSPKVGSPLSSDPYTKTLTVEDLGITGQLYPNPAAQGQQVTFDITTTGNAKYLKIYIPNEISSLDKKGTAFPITKTIVEEEHHNEKIAYMLPINTPVTLDSNGNRVRQPYVIPVEAQKANGTSKSITLYLDVKGNILDGIKTEIIGTGQDRN
ncbi:hypothetical protein [Clostridium guangxiense]|uniref:hypothetical protein n=1 Tax=Clostridium guangxiense TaxID=1662055 RepID=UPI001E5C9A05|nr:hypothetical protein [Clostridium guangxiense]MCD2345099.1 hypothetical protein [Clostridium guangxiense]